MNRPYLRCERMTFSYPGAPAPLFENLTLHFSTGWNGVIGANGTGKSTLLQLATALLEPDSGRISTPADRLYCPQRTDEPPPGLPALLADRRREAMEIRRTLGLEEEWPARWATLSHGERKRAQVGAALWRNPALLALDEPFNHLDDEAAERLLRALTTYRGVGLLVCHDRAVLDTLCGCCLFLDPPQAIVRPGGYTAVMETIDRERTAVAMERRRIDQTVDRLQEEFLRRRQEAQGPRGKISKRGLHKHDTDGRARCDRARLTGRDGVAGRLQRRMDQRLEQERKKCRELPIHKEYRLGIRFADAPCRRDFLFTLPAGVLPLGGGRELHYPELAMKPGQRVALRGANGSGKSTLLRHIAARIALAAERVIHIPQEIDRERSAALLEEVLHLPEEPLGFLMTVLSRLGSRPGRLLHTELPSPGETRKLMLALGLLQQPYLIIMDEPTNHMDLPSIVCLEEALAETPCAMLLVSHDRRFLQALAQDEWTISPVPGSRGATRLQIV